MSRKSNQGESMASEGKILEQHSTIGGLLWLPALWTVTNVFAASYYIITFPLVGWVMMVFAAINAHLFWTRSMLYRWYFIVHTVVGMLLMTIASGPRVAANGVVLSIFIMFYLLFSKRPRGTFTQPLFIKPRSILFKNFKLKLVGLLFLSLVWVVADYYVSKDPVNIEFQEYIRLNGQVADRIGSISSITLKKKSVTRKSVASDGSTGSGYRRYMYVVRGERGGLVVRLKRVDGSGQVELTILGDH